MININPIYDEINNNFQQYDPELLQELARMDEEIGDGPIPPEPTVLQILKREIIVFLELMFINMVCAGGLRFLDLPYEYYWFIISALIGRSKIGDHQLFPFSARNLFRHWLRLFLPFSLFYFSLFFGFDRVAKMMAYGNHQALSSFKYPNVWTEILFVSTVFTMTGATLRFWIQLAVLVAQYIQFLKAGVREYHERQYNVGPGGDGDQLPAELVQVDGPPTSFSQPNMRPNPPLA